ncbi:ribonuclease R family protein [Capillimicrobium parvum]|uniref:Ribonuclease R n=1 Tax=Capillimicrobium parvum TaxID=2884022 RepID=A0A9E6XW04_9ACTN|nr:RNB domain-containing ribonuclease [Capillimicrobium parvum]UGS35108.1 Ribonuclease R [Capillimicrobium parvum]
MSGGPAGLVGELVKRGRYLTVAPFFAPGRGVPVESSREARVGDLVLVRPGRGPKQRAKVLRVLGRPDNARALIEAFMLDRGLPRRFDPAVERAAREARDAGGEAGASRRDLRDLTTFTIDPVTAKDFDDAISADGSRIWVHIADVGAFVRPGSLVDREAARRGTSVYVPGAVEPMLPEALSNDACSLRPNQDRLAVTVEMDFDGARVTRAAFYRSVIRSDERLDYDRVDRVFAGAEPWAQPWGEPLRAARAVAAALQAARERHGALAVESAEPDFAFDPRGNVTGAERSVQTESHRLIEHLMIAANEQVATLLEQRHVPALYRVHERPEPLRVQRLVDQLASLSVPTPPVPEPMSPSQAAEIVAECSHRVDEHVRRVGHGRQGLTSLVLRALKQAYYSPRNLGHAGLSSAAYCHFTSPIRRYPDLVCHRALLSAVGGGEEAPNASKLPSVAEWSSARERDAMDVERTADDIARCLLLERELFENGFDREFAGEVTGVIGAGAFVAFGDGYEGMLPVRRLRGDWWELNEPGTILEGTRSGGSLRVGDEVAVRVERVDSPRGRVDLGPLEDEFGSATV